MRGLQGGLVGIEFFKAHGTGNDFLLLPDPLGRLRLGPGSVRVLAHRKLGVGADGVIRVAPGSSQGALFMDYWNADGTPAEMCGNGIRCLVQVALEVGMASGSEVTVETRAGRRRVEVLSRRPFLARVSMGTPLLKGCFVLDGAPELGEGIVVDVGNPHCVFVLSSPRMVAVESLGPRVEKDPAFPGGTNVEFLARQGDRLEMRVWERGVGETLSCGTGAVAAALAASVRGLVEEKRVRLAPPGGELVVEWGPRGEAFLEGPSELVFRGELEDELVERVGLICPDLPEGAR